MNALRTQWNDNRAVQLGRDYYALDSAIAVLDKARTDLIEAADMTDPGVDCRTAIVDGLQDLLGDTQPLLEALGQEIDACEARTFGDGNP